MQKFFWLSLGLLLAMEAFAQDIYQIDQVQEVRLVFQRPDWEKALDSLKDKDEDERLLADLVFNGVKYPNVGVRYKGNSSFNGVRKQGSNKLPLNIKVNYRNKKQSLPGGYSSLKLSNVFRDPSFLREVLSYEIAGKYMHAPRANYAKVYVNDHYLGLYNSSESVDSRFLNTKFGNSNGVLVKCDPVWNSQAPGNCPAGNSSSLVYQGEDTLCYQPFYELKSSGGWKDLVALTNTLNNDPENVDRLLNVDQTLWMLAFNNVLVNLDSYSGMLCHNYYLYRDTFGVFHPVVWDMNLSFGGFRYAEGGKALSNEEMQKLSPFLHYRNEKRPLISKLLSNKFYRKVFLAHMRTIINENFSNDAFTQRAKALHNLIAPHVESDDNKLYDFEYFRLNLHQTATLEDQEIIGLTELMGPRLGYLSAHPLLNIEELRINNVEHQKGADELLIKAQVAGAEAVWLYYRQKDKGNFQRLPMINGAASGDAERPWQVNIPAVKDVQYYLVAEGDKTAVLSPERASMEFYEVK